MGNTIIPSNEMGFNPSSYFSQRLQTAEPEAEKAKMESLFKAKYIKLLFYLVGPFAVTNE